jgi:gas vesicle protein
MWLMIGAAVGAGIALLYAPKTGRETRKLLRRKAEDAKESILETSEQLRDKVADTGETLRDAGRDIYRKATAAAAEAADVLEMGRRAVKR